MTGYEKVGKNEVLVIYDDEKTNAETISNALSKGKMPIQGTPVFIE